MTPRSMTLGQMAAPVGRGATEVAVMGGFAYAAQTNPPVSGTDNNEPVVNQPQNRGFLLPAAEANIQHGFSEHVALNLHASSAGVQPGVKITINESKVAHFALLPAIAFGYGSLGSSTYQSHADGRLLEVNPTSTTSLSFLGGFKMLVSHRSGLYGGVGYDFILQRTLTTTAPNVSADRAETLVVTLSHQIMLAIGFDISLGRVHLRPEIAASVYPAISQSTSTRVGSVTNDGSASGGFGWAILPGLGIAIASDRVEAPEEKKDEEDDDEDRGRRTRHRTDDEDDVPPAPRREDGRDD